MESLELALSQNFRSVDYFMELHREIERLKTEKLILLRYNFENQEKFEEMKKKQEELEKAKSLKDLVLTLNIIDMLSFTQHETSSNFLSQAVKDAKREMKLLKIGKKN